MEIFIIAIPIIGIIAFCHIGNQLIKVLTEINNNINNTQNELKKLNPIHAMDFNLTNITYGLEKIALAVNPKSPDLEIKHESVQKPEWQIENETRKELYSMLSPVTQDEFTEFLSNRYHLSKRDPWISKISKIRISIGLEPAITEIRKRDTISER